MLMTIKGIYDKGQIVLEETPSIKDKSKVVVTFLDEIKPAACLKRRLGSLKGKVSIPDDFNEPLDDLKEYMN